MFAQEAVDKAQGNCPHRIPSLDGCRAVSILVVVVAHLCETPAFQALDPFARLMFHFGPYGVEVFFVISASLSRLYCSTKSAGMAEFPSESFISGAPSESGRWPTLICSLWLFSRGVM